MKVALKGTTEKKKVARVMGRERVDSFHDLSTELDYEDILEIDGNDSNKKFHSGRSKKTKSSKRKFISFGDSDIPANKIPKLNSSCSGGPPCLSSKYFSNMLADLSVHQRNVVENFGFGCLLKSGTCKVPTELVKCIVRHVDVRTSQIITKGKLIPFNKNSVHLVFGLLVGGVEILANSDSGRSFIMSKFGLSSLPHISFFWEYA
uniref:Uncharacterized protein n=1 Tax=Leersia perrieri TaxID=77586 RepID=A0A0D9X5V2_9ORYZ